MTAENGPFHHRLHHVDEAARREHTARLGKRGAHGVLRHVMQGAAKDHPVSRTVACRKRLGPPLDEGHALSFRRRAVALGLNRVRLDAEHRGTALGQRTGQRAAAATDIDERMTMHRHQPVQHGKIGACAPAFDGPRHGASIAGAPAAGPASNSARRRGGCAIIPILI